MSDCFWTDYVGCSEDCGNTGGPAWWMRTIYSQALDTFDVPDSEGGQVGDGGAAPDLQIGDTLTVVGGKAFYTGAGVYDKWPDCGWPVYGYMPNESPGAYVIPGTTDIPFNEFLTLESTDRYGHLVGPYSYDWIRPFGAVNAGILGVDGAASDWHSLDAATGYSVTIDGGGGEDGLLYSANEDDSALAIFGVTQNGDTPVGTLLCYVKLHNTRSGDTYYVILNQARCY